MEKRNWFAIMQDGDDDWGTGSFDFDEAIKMADEYGCRMIAEIDGDYDETGNPTCDTICVAEYIKGEDF